MNAQEHGLNSPVSPAGHSTAGHSPAGRLSTQDRKDLDKFTKYFVYKTVQVVVQSRLGIKLHTQSKHLSTGSDWFNLSIRDHADVLAETKKVYTGPDCLLGGAGVCVEISLKTVEGESMVLECWSLEMTDRFDASVRVSFAVYNSIGALLKCLMSVSRTLPAYRLSRRQGPESYVVCYRAYVGAPNVVHLGDGYCVQPVGSVPTPAGTLCVNAAYRTVLLMSPQRHTHELNLTMDHFVFDAPDRYREGSAGHRDSPIDRSDDAMATDSPGSARRVGSAPHRVAAFAQCQPAETAVETDLPFEKLLACTGASENIPVTRSADTDDADMKRSIQSMQVTSSGGSGSSIPSANHQRELPIQTAGDNSALHEMRPPPIAAFSDEEELSNFFRTVREAPPLGMFEQESTVPNMLNSITDQLAQFEENAKVFDEFISSLKGLDIN